MISTDKAPPEDVHEPHIIIRQNGILKREYRGFEEVNGDVRLDVYPAGKGLTHYRPRSSSDPRQSLARLIDIQRDLYPKQKLKVHPESCAARFHFDTGKLYTQRLESVSFVEMKTRKPCGHSPSLIAGQVGLEIRIPDRGYAVLHFMNDADDFVFKPGRDYEVEIANRAEATMSDHFKYLYKVVRPKPKTLWVPVPRPELEHPGLPSTSEAIPRGSGGFGDGRNTRSRGPAPRYSDKVPCTPGGFGDVQYTQSKGPAPRYSDKVPCTPGGFGNVSYKRVRRAG